MGSDFKKKHVELVFIFIEASLVFASTAPTNGGIQWLLR